MIPLGDVVPRRTAPRVTCAVTVVLLAAVLVLHLAFPPEQRLQLLWTYGASRVTFPWPALATACWLDPSWIAGAANAAAIALFGPSVEDRLGPARFALLLALGGVAAVTSVTLFDRTPALPAGGAAGPAAAVMGAYIGLFPRSRLAFWTPLSVRVMHEVPIYWAMAVWGLLVLVNVERYSVLDPARLPPLWGVAAAMAIGLASAFLLPLRERLTLDWWDGATADASAPDRC